MKVQNDTGWLSLVNKILSKKPVDKLEEINKEFSPYSSNSTLTNVWSANHLSKRKNCQKSKKRHRFPPSLLSSRAADFWNTLMPLRLNCSCSSISVGEKSSRSSFGISISDATFGPNSDSSVLPFNETVARETLGDTLGRAHLAFELFLTRMVRLVNILNEKSGSFSSYIYSSPNLKVILPPNPEQKKSTEIIVADSHRRFLSNTSLSLDSGNHRENWSTGKTGKRCESSSKLEIATEQKRRGKSSFSSSFLVPKTLKISKSVLTKEELVYLLQYKKTLLSEYFQRKLDSTDLKKNLNSTERSEFVYGTQSDSRLQEHNLLKFVQFIKARRQKDVGDELKKTVNSPEIQKSKIECDEESQNSSSPKRRVTFSCPLTEETIDPENYCSFDNTIRDNFDQEIKADALFDSKSVSPSDSSVSLKACFANLSLKSFTNSTDCLINYDEYTTEQTVYEKYITDERLGSLQSEFNGGIKSGDKSPGRDILDLEMLAEQFLKEDNVNPIMTVKKLEVDEDEDLLEKSLSSASLSSLQKLIQPDVANAEDKLHAGLKFLVREMLDCGTTHVPISDYIGSSIIPKVDGATPRITLQECSSKKNFDKCLRRKTCPIEIGGDCNSVDNDLYSSNCELEDLSVESKISEYSENRKAKIPLQSDYRKLNQSFSEGREMSDTRMNSRPVSTSGKTVTFQDQEELRSFEDISFNSSDLDGLFELSWKGCWEGTSTVDFVQNKARQTEGNRRKGERKSVESNPTAKISSESVLRTPMESKTMRTNPSSKNLTISGSQTSYYTTMEEKIQLENNDESIQKKRNFKETSSSSYSNPSTYPSFEAVADSLEEDEPIPWNNNFREDSPKARSIYGSQSNREAIKLKNRNICKGIINPEIWRSEVKSELKNFSKSDWFTKPDSDKLYSSKIPEIRKDWLFRRLEELQSSPETDYESDCYLESEIESEYEYDRDLSPIKRSFSDLGMHSENVRKLKIREEKFRPNSLSSRVWPKRKIIFNECRCHKNTPRTRNDPCKERDLAHAVFQDSDQRSNQNFFSHLRARIILDSGTDDSDFAPSIQSDFRYDFDQRDDHVNKMKCRRFVKSLKSINSGLLNVTFQKSFSPASVQSAISTRTVGTNISEKQTFYNTMDVCIDTYDLCPRKPIGTENGVSGLAIFNKNSSCQTGESLFGVSNSMRCNEKGSRSSSNLLEKDTGSGSNLKIARGCERRMNTVLANLSIQINNASENLAKLRFSEIQTKPETVVLSPPRKENNSSSNLSAQSTPPIHLRVPTSIKNFTNVRCLTKKSSNILNNSDSCTVSNSCCPICDSHKKPTGRYVLPACIVKGESRDIKTNEKDPWNHVMEKAMAQNRYEGRDKSSCFEMKSSLKRSRVMSSVCKSISSRSFEGNQRFSTSNKLHREEIKIQVVQVENNSCQATVSDADNPAVEVKISSPPRTDRPIKIPPASALCSSTTSDFWMFNSPRTRSRSPGENRKSQALPNMSNRLLYIISETGELNHQASMKPPPLSFFG